MQCDVCGCDIKGKPYHVIIEGAKLTVCAKCARLGSAEWKPEEGTMRFTPKLPRQIKPRRTGMKWKDVIQEDITVIENYGSIIRRARQSMGLSQEDLGRRINEKVSVIKKLEGEKIVPDERLARKIEHALGIKLLVPFTMPEVPSDLSRISREVTLGDIVHLKDSRRKLRNEGNNS
ncbi:TIGR00270 family protein [Candidatus Bathyarchaeota archaeon]|nr:MAG: TIGR00270 family protein [Candidatus Bathyarchaeota archaeon]